ncbi:MAG: PA0069 family radical SAM protein, partial [Proteobacteria bacterium]|nr:PA0069 family radical SAM protein [Pseudomonadota bacterium]
MPAPHGRGASSNPAGRFETISYALDPDIADLSPDELPAPQTTFLRDDTSSIISTNDSPDVMFDASMNPYRGCEHGCIYCYARPTHEYLGFSAGLDFETRIMVKENAPALLRDALSSKRWTPQVLGLSGVTDAYQPIERKLGLTRRCLEVLTEFRNPVIVITKNVLVTRDADLLGDLARHDAAAVCISIASLDATLARRLEPRAPTPERRLEAISALTSAGVPVCVLAAPVIPGLNDHEVPAVICAAARAGARWADYTALRLPHGVKDLFSDWLSEHFPNRRDKVLNRIRAMRGGRLNSSDFTTRMRGEGVFADEVAQ